MVDFGDFEVGIEVIGGGVAAGAAEAGGIVGRSYNFREGGSAGCAWIDIGVALAAGCAGSDEGLVDRGVDGAREEVRRR